LNASERLQAGRAATYDGRYEDALAHFLWYHDHALSEDSSLAGVRLSFALGYWEELGEKYPAAMEIFRGRRDAKVAILRAGQLDRGLFHDVEAMSERLNEDEVTAELFAMLHERRPEFAHACRRIALPMLVRSRRYVLAREYMPEPQAHVAGLTQELIQDIEEIEQRPRTKAPRFRAFTHNFAQDLRDVLVVLRSTGSAKLAAQLQLEALILLKYKYIRNAVTKHLPSEA